MRSPTPWDGWFLGRDDWFFRKSEGHAHRTFQNEVWPIFASARSFTFQACSAGFSAALTSTAGAEVCDKMVGAWWVPLNGAVTFALRPTGIGAIAITVLALAIVLKFRLLRTGAVLLLFTAAVAALQVGTVIQEQDVLSQAYHEGCLSSLSVTVDVLMSLALVAASAVTVLLIWKSGRGTQESRTRR